LTKLFSRNKASSLQVQYIP